MSSFEKTFDFLNDVLNTNKYSRLDIYNSAKERTDSFKKEPLMHFMQDVGNFSNKMIVSVAEVIPNSLLLFKPVDYSIGGLLRKFINSFDDDNCWEILMKTQEIDFSFLKDHEEELRYPRDNDVIYEEIRELIKSPNVARKIEAIEEIFGMCNISGNYDNIVYLSNILQKEYKAYSNEPSDNLGLSYDNVMIEQCSKKVATRAILELLGRVGVNRNNSDVTKLSKLIAALTGYSARAIRNEITKNDELTMKTHGHEIDFLNQLMRELNLNILIRYNKYR